MTAVYGLQALGEVLQAEAVLAAVRAALIAHARGEIVSPAPGQLLFASPPGDCHIKSAHARGGEVFVVKVATGFYDNPALGRPVNNGVVLVFSATTGEPLAILADEGWLTSWRTAAAGALAISAVAPEGPLGVVGAGHQAELQALWGSRALGGAPVRIWGRSADRAAALAERLAARGLDVRALDRLDDLLQACGTIVTCTSAGAPLIEASAVRPGAHVVSLGADSPGKRELDTALFARAATILVDDLGQCLAHGDFGRAVSERRVAEGSALLLGDVLAGHRLLRRGPGDISVATLTGIGAADLAIAELAWRRLRDPGGPAPH